jgi:signal transduction histidine kinase
LDTKLKNFSRSSATKFTAFLLTVILLSAAFMQLIILSYKNVNFDVLFVNEYQESDYFIYYDVSNTLNDMMIQLEDGAKLPANPDVYYYITDGENIYFNADADKIKQYKTPLFLYEDGEWTLGEDANYGTPYVDYPENYRIYFTFTEEFMEERQQLFEANRTLLIPSIVFIAICSVLSLLFILYLIAVTGRDKIDEEIHLSKVDNIYTDIQLIFGVFTLALWFEYMRSYYYVYGDTISNKLTPGQIMYMIMSGIVTAITITICGIILLSLVRKLKAGRLIKQSLIYTIFYKISDFIKSFFDDRRYAHYPLTKALQRRQVTFIPVSAGLVFFTMLFIAAGSPLLIVPPILELVMIYWYYTENNKTYEKINRGLQDSLEDQMKSERMKVALVTNVSHDLKTPLTSIISYVELLSKEELSETAKDYVNILADKSERLKHIVSDLFDLAKSTSGNMPMDMEDIDLKKLLEQTLADMEDDIIKSGLPMKTKLPNHAVIIRSDGKKLYRVFQNVIDNALKYSLTGTRVFVETEESEDRVNVTIKNTAAYEMDFTPEEVLARFNRGDKSRTTEGSGLGLSIAESFTNVCGGNFKVDIDGDLFKVTIGFRAYK